ncbi:uncharacterized protein BO87DRAFT_458926 [Aspergillus neoniger CBS 115656]|uniref:Uncharacterized protein n=1 Tax=Aspergillus neoniger (strain CBS 115656) TaxID=1448310 RepID=A0A318ZEJ2_ASPNB|nr:hypothetical protein BO87DRAFT_458926 [Aspergillus neoniger CBS 115656]PYH34572.1 hypothetical protein BO87DRAFT_458926 [Aspergillus neoniger CBS 115656]
MSVSEPAERRKLRKTLRAYCDYVQELEVHEFDAHRGKLHKISILPLELEEKSDARPIFFTPCSASIMADPVESMTGEGREFIEFDSFPEHHRDPLYCSRFLLDRFSGYISICSDFSDRDEAYELKNLQSDLSIDEPPLTNLHQFSYPEWLTVWATKLAKGPQPHIKAFVCNNMNGTNAKVLRGEVMVTLRLMIAHMKSVRFVEQLTAPVLLFSFMGPQHARLIEAYFDGNSLIMRPTRLFDLRKMDADVIRTMGQWFFGMATGETTRLWEAGSRACSRT